MAEQEPKPTFKISRLRLDMATRKVKKYSRKYKAAKEQMLRDDKRPAHG